MEWFLPIKMIGESDMSIYQHDTNYFSYDIVSTIERIVNVEPALDRGGVYIWIIRANGSDSQMIIYFNANENDNRGSLECHCNGQFKSQIDFYGVLDLDDSGDDCLFNKEKIVNYINSCINS